MERSTGQSTPDSEAAGQTDDRGEGSREEALTSGPTPALTSEASPCPERTAASVALLATSQTSAETDKEALLALFEATDGESWDQSGAWGGRATIGDWEGVTVDNEGRVTSLQLSELAGRLPPEMGNLTSLRTLDISDSRLTDGLPPELGNLVSLTNLRIRESGAPGGLPRELGSLGSLWELDLAGNQLAGEIPPELGSLAKLWRLDLSENGLGGEIPPELGGLASLLALDLGENRLTGDLTPGAVQPCRSAEIAFTGQSTNRGTAFAIG